MRPAFVPREVPGGKGCKLTDDSHIDVWYASLDLDREPSPAALSTLSGDELQRASTMAPTPRRRFVAARALLRQLVASYLGSEAGTVAFSYGTHGKPRLAGRAHRLHFNLSHAGSRALFAFGGNRVGVDLEVMRPLRDPDAVAKRFFSEREKQLLAALHPSTRQRAFFTCWTRKEAYVKALGTGIANTLPGFSVVIDPFSEPALQGVNGEPDPNWTLHHLEPEAGLMGAVAANQRECELRCWSLVRRTDEGVAQDPSPSMKLVS